MKNPRKMEAWKKQFTIEIQGNMGWVLNIQTDILQVKYSFIVQNIEACR